MVREFTSNTGNRILVGENARDNERLSLQVASVRDVWFHVDEGSGSHVILKNEKPTQDEIQYVADIAAYYSSRRGDKEVVVIYGYVSDLTKPKYSQVGTVEITGYQTVCASPKRYSALNKLKRLK